MNLWVLIPLTLACFAGGILLSRWQARRQYRAYMADKVARKVEEEIARRAVERFSEKHARQTGEKPAARQQGR